MKLSMEGAALALQTFCSRRPSEAELLKIVQDMDTYKDLLAHILLETDFLDTHPDIQDILKRLSPSVTRTLHSSSSEATHVRSYLIRQLSAKLYEQQKLYAEHSAALLQIEQNIITIKGSIEGIGRS